MTVSVSLSHCFAVSLFLFLCSPLNFRILSHFNAKDYTVIFTYNTTHSLRLLGDSFVFPEKATDTCDLIDRLSSNSSLGYLADSHHSVVGMREIVRTRVSKK